MRGNHCAPTFRRGHTLAILTIIRCDTVLVTAGIGPECPSCGIQAISAVRRRDRLRDIWRTPARICAFLARPATATSEQNKQGDESTSQAEYAGSIPVIGFIKPQLRGLRSLQTLYPRLSFDRPVTVADLKAVCWRLSEI